MSSRFCTSVLPPATGVPDIPKFNSSCSDPESWTEDYELLTELHGWTPKMQVHYFNLFIDDPHLHWVKKLRTSDGIEWESFKKQFIAESRSRLGLTPANSRIKLDQLQMLPGDHFSDYLSKFEGIAKHVGSIISDFEKRRSFFSGLSKEFQDRVYSVPLLHRKCESTYEYLVAAAKAAETYFQVK